MTSAHIELSAVIAKSLESWETDNVTCLFMGSIWQLIERMPPKDVAAYLAECVDELKEAQGRQATVH